MRRLKHNFQRAAVVWALLFGPIACTTSAYADKTTAQDHAVSLQRIVALGDVHGDFDQMVSILRTANVIDKRQRWIGGDTHLVQLGDIPDRGPDTRKAMDLLMELQEDSQEDGGNVTVLIGNHDAMMVTGDLRYVHPGEYAAFKGRNSKALRKAYYQRTIAHLKDTLPPEQIPEFNKEYRLQWEARFPLGYVEHRLAWTPTGKYGKWVLSRPAVAKIGDTLFVHGGISPGYSDMSISEINTRVRTALAEGQNIAADSIVEDEAGPLWDRGWIIRSQDEETTASLDQVLQKFQVKRMVVAHTPVAPIIVPRFGGKVLMADVGLSAHYGGASAYLEIVGDNLFAIINGEKVPLPQNATEIEKYFDAAERLVEDPRAIIRYRQDVAQAKIDAAKGKPLDPTEAQSPQQESTP